MRMRCVSPCANCTTLNQMFFKLRTKLIKTIKKAPPMNISISQSVVKIFLTPSFTHNWIHQNQIHLKFKLHTPFNQHRIMPALREPSHITSAFFWSFYTPSPPLSASAYPLPHADVSIAQPPSFWKLIFCFYYQK